MARSSKNTKKAKVTAAVVPAAVQGCPEALIAARVAGAYYEMGAALEDLQTWMLAYEHPDMRPDVGTLLRTFERLEEIHDALAEAKRLGHMAGACHMHRARAVGPEAAAVPS